MISRASTAFCWLPPERLENGAPRAPRADVEALHHLAGLALQLAPPQETEAGELLQPVEIDVIG